MVSAPPLVASKGSPYLRANSSRNLFVPGIWLGTTPGGRSTSSTGSQGQGAIALVGHTENLSSGPEAREVHGIVCDRRDRQIIAMPHNMGASCGQSLRGTPFSPVQFSLRCVVSTTSVSPSQCPVEIPPRYGAHNPADAADRPSRLFARLRRRKDACDTRSPFA